MLESNHRDRFKAFVHENKYLLVMLLKQLLAINIHNYSQKQILTYNIH